MPSTLPPQAGTPAATRPFRAVLALVRPRQWGKNLLVVAAPLAAGALGERGVLAATIVAFAAFTLAAAGTYALNDVVDREADAAHPGKRHRPVASGRVDVRFAVVLGGGLGAGSIVLPLAAGNVPLAVMVVAYLALTSAYSQWLKHVALMDIAAVAGGFLLRAMAGAVAADLPMSRWFLVVVGFGSLYVVANKRAAEHRASGADGAGPSRQALVGYSTELLREIRLITAAVTIVGYVSWALDRTSQSFGEDPWATISIAPFAFAMFRYAAAVDAGLGEAPEEILLRDRVIQGLGVLWLLVFGMAVHAG